MTTNNICIYFQDLCQYALNKIYEKFNTNIYITTSNTGYNWPPSNLPKELNNNVEFTYLSSDDCTMYTTPQVVLPNKIMLGTINDTNNNTVGGQLRTYLISKGVFSNNNSIMTTKCILNFFSCIASFISSKTVTFRGTTHNDSSYTYILYNTENTDMINITNLEDNTNELTQHQYNQTVDDILNCITNKDNINSNVLIVKYSSSSSSSSSCSCSCSCSSCSSSSSSSSSFIVYMLI